MVLQNYDCSTPQELAFAINALGELPKGNGTNSALYERLRRTRIKHNKEHSTSLTNADFVQNVFGVTVKVSNQNPIYIGN